MNKISRKILKYFSILHPRSIYKIIVHLYLITDELAGTRTQELINIIDEKNIVVI